MYKKADSRLLYVWDILIFVSIGLIIAITVGLFFAAEIDVRLEEAQILSNKLVGGIIENGRLDKNALDKDFDILEKAGIDEKILVNGGDFYFKVEIFDDLVITFSNGTKDFEEYCKLEGDELPECYEREFFVLKDDKKLKIKILTASNQRG